MHTATLILIIYLTAQHCKIIYNSIAILGLDLQTCKGVVLLRLEISLKVICEKVKGTCIKGLIWPPMEPKKMKIAVHKFLSIGILEEWLKSKILAFFINFTVAMVTKMADKIDIK